MLGWIKVLITGMVGGLALSAPEIVRRVLTSLGVGVFVFTGMSLLLNTISSHIQQSFTGAAPIVVQIAGLLQIDSFITIVLSALSIRLTMSSMGGLAPKQLGLF